MVRANFLISWYLSSAPFSTFFIGISLFSPFCTRTELIAFLDTKRYKIKGSPFCGRTKMGGEDKKIFKLLEGPLEFLGPLELQCLPECREKRMNLSLEQDKNLDKADILLTSCCTSFTKVGLLMLIMDWHLSKSVLMPLWVNMKCINFHTWTPKEHLFGLRCMLYFLIEAKPGRPRKSTCSGWGACCIS